MSDKTKSVVIEKVVVELTECSMQHPSESTRSKKTREAKENAGNPVNSKDK